MNSNRCSLLSNTSFKNTSSNQSALYLIITKFLALSAAARTRGGALDQFLEPGRLANNNFPSPRGPLRPGAGSKSFLVGLLSMRSLTAGLKRVIERQINAGLLQPSLTAPTPAPVSSCPPRSARCQIFSINR